MRTPWAYIRVYVLRGCAFARVLIGASKHTHKCLPPEIMWTSFRQILSCLLRSFIYIYIYINHNAVTKHEDAQATHKGT